MKTMKRLTAVALVLLLLLSLCGCIAEELPEEISRPETTRTTAATTLSTAPTTTATVTITDTTVVTTDATTTQTATQTATTVVTTQVTTKVTATATGSTATTAVPTSEISQSTHTQMTRPDYGVKTDAFGRPLYEPNQIVIRIRKEYIVPGKKFTAADFPGIKAIDIETLPADSTSSLQWVFITLEGYGDEVLNEAISQAEQLPFVEYAMTNDIDYSPLP